MAEDPTGGYTRMDVDPNNPEGSVRQYTGRTQGLTAQCVPLVQSLAGMPTTKNWSEGPSVLSMPPPPGTAIATFNPRDQGAYGNHTDHTNHAAIYLGPSPDGKGIRVLQQFVGAPAHVATIPINSNAQFPIHDASQYKIINPYGRTSKPGALQVAAKNSNEDFLDGLYGKTTPAPAGGVAPGFDANGQPLPKGWVGKPAPVAVAPTETPAVTAAPTTEQPKAPSTTDSFLDSLFGPAKDAVAPVDAAKPGTMDYVVGQAKMGAAQGGQNVAAANQAELYQHDQPGVVGNWIRNKMGLGPANLNQGVQPVQMTEEQMNQETYGKPAVEAPSDSARYMGAGARSLATNPLAVMAGGPGAMGVGLSSVIGSGVGGEAGADLGPSIGLSPETGRKVGAVLGSLSPLVSGAVRSGVGQSPKYSPAPPPRTSTETAEAVAKTLSSGKTAIPEKDLLAVVRQANSALRTEAGVDPTTRSAIDTVLKSLGNKEDGWTTSTRQLNGVRNLINDQIEKQIASKSSNSNIAVEQLKQIRNKIDDAIDKTVPGARMDLGAHQEALERETAAANNPSPTPKQPGFVSKSARAIGGDLGNMAVHVASNYAGVPYVAPIVGGAKMLYYGGKALSNRFGR